MPKFRLMLFFFASLCVAVIGFNNCSKVNFAPAQTELPSSASGQGDGSLPITQEEIDEIIDNLPTEIRDNPIPVSDISQDPSLLDKFACGDGGVLICHFPDGWAAQHTQCIGRPAAETHFDHVRDEMVEGSSMTFYDYLGSCRFTIDAFPQD